MEKFYNRFLECDGVSIDSRAITPNCFFVALKGPSFNGNAFAAQAIEKGAKYAIVDEKEFVDEVNGIFLVDDGLQFLQKLANFHRKQFSIPFIGITGSNGKTSSKELITAVLSEKYRVLATQGNLNNHIGVPLTLLKVNASHEIAVIEMGANHFGDIKELCEIANPTHGLITNIGKAHLEGFINFEGVLKTKKELYDAVESVNGTLFFNGDDEVLKGILPPAIDTIAYGTNGEVNITGELIRLTPFVELQWTDGKYQSPIVSTKLVGQYNFFNFLAAITVGHFFNVEPGEINHALENYMPTNKRSQVVETTKNMLILDCYNANPTSMRSALESFAKIERTPKIVIIGDMLELGLESEKEHQLILDLVKDLGLSAITVGDEFGKISNNSFQHFSHTRDVISFLKDNTIENHLVLLKGSRGIGLEVLEESL